MGISVFLPDKIYFTGMRPTLWQFEPTASNLQARLYHGVYIKGFSNSIAVQLRL